MPHSPHVPPAERRRGARSAGPEPLGPSAVSVTRVVCSQSSLMAQFAFSFVSASRTSQTLRLHITVGKVFRTALYVL
ncbi:hypothetical protein EVAR_24178_1 [Eumeta japonica]|uniref:Uncharacterized protein n=1 Tax=Eumeta variegata TaxID=151549 RepID=A0A4C1W765_EUMVA|nr:hypothetical protein EVAR_24178_1 [Eumeta japonica]